MAIQYVKVKRTINLGNNPGEKYLARIVRGTDISLDHIAMDISNSTTISHPDVMACLKALEIEIEKYMLLGRAVKLKYLGSFIPAISAKAMNSADEVKSNTIRKLRCRFYPSTNFKADLANCKFKLANLNIQGLQQ